MKQIIQRSLPTEKGQSGLVFDLDTDALLDAVEAKGHEVRRWKGGLDGRDCGIFRVTPNGRWRAIGRFWSVRPDQAVIYRCMQPYEAAK